MELQDRIVGHLAENKFGCTARELSKSIGERLDLVQEHLLVMAAMSTVKSRLVGRDQVYMLVSGKDPVPTPRELLAQAQAAVDAATPALKPTLVVKPVADPTVVEPTPRPAPVPPAAVAVPREPLELVDGQHKRPRASLYQHVGGTITLDLLGKPITARFTSVEQLKKFVDDLIEAGREPEKG